MAYAESSKPDSGWDKEGSSSPSTLSPYFIVYRICGAGLFVSCALSLLADALAVPNLAHVLGPRFTGDVFYFIPGAAVAIFLGLRYLRARGAR